MVKLRKKFLFTPKKLVSCYKILHYMRMVLLFILTSNVLAIVQSVYKKEPANLNAGVIIFVIIMIIILIIGGLKKLLVEEIRRSVGIDTRIDNLSTQDGRLVQVSVLRANSIWRLFSKEYSNQKNFEGLVIDDGAKSKTQLREEQRKLDNDRTEELLKIKTDKIILVPIDIEIGQDVLTIDPIISVLDNIDPKI